MIIFIVGDPHRGKSVMENKLRHLLPLQETMRIAAQVDGEGDWTQQLYRESPELVATLRVKGKFTPEFVAWAKSAVANCKSRFGLADLGGRISDENRQIIRAATAKGQAGMIVLAASFDEASKWVTFGQEFGLRIIAVLLSSLEPQPEWHKAVVTDKPWKFEGLVVGLDRANRTLDSATLKALATHLLETIPSPQEESMHFNRITIDQVARLIGKQPEEIKLPGREPTMGLNWRPEELPKVYQALQPFAAMGSNWLIDGRAPQFLVVDIVHALHPCTVALADEKVADGFVTIGERKELIGEGSGPLPWRVTPDFLGGTLVEYARDAFTIVDVGKLNEVIPPAVPIAQPVFLSGKTANWAACEIAMAYAHRASTVYLFQPGTGFICVITHNVEHPLGSVVKTNPPA